LRENGDSRKDEHRDKIFFHAQNVSDYALRKKDLEGVRNLHKLYQKVSVVKQCLNATFCTAAKESIKNDTEELLI